MRITESYTSIYTRAPIFSSAGGSPGGLVLDHFQSPPGELPEGSYAEHHILINLHDRQEFHQRRGRRDHKFCLTPGDIVVTPSGVENGWRWDTTSNVVIARIPPTALAQFATTQVQTRLANEPLIPHVGFRDLGLLKIAEAFLNGVKAGSPTQRIYEDSLHIAFLALLIDRHCNYVDLRRREPLPLDNSQTAIVAEYIRENIDCDLALSDLAQQVGLSEYHFARCFKAKMGISPHQYVMHERTTRARALLEKTNTPLIDIAALLGFSDQSHFIRVFKKVVGVTPLKYRLGQKRKS